MNILREDWKPVLNLNSVMVGLQYLFLEPNPDDPLNKGAFRSRSFVCIPRRSRNMIEAALEMTKNRDQFLNNVKQTMRGGYFKSVQYDNVLAR